MEQYGKDIASERAYINELNRQKNLLLVAVVGPSIIGCVGALQADAGLREQTAHILHVGLHLKETYRGLGIGSQMLAYTIEWAQERGFKKIEASIYTTNKRSLDLFIREGFTQEGIRQRSIRIGKDYIDVVLMGKVLE